MKLFITQFYRAPCNFLSLSLRSKYSPQHPVLNDPEPIFLVWETKIRIFAPMKKQNEGEIIVLYKNVPHSQALYIWYRVVKLSTDQANNIQVTFTVLIFPSEDVTARYPHSTPIKKKSTFRPSLRTADSHSESTVVESRPAEAEKLVHFPQSHHTSPGKVR